MFRPAVGQMTTMCRLQTPTTASTLGVNTKTYVDAKGLISANWKSYGGTETTSNGVLSVEDTAQVVAWYRPDITSGCRIVRVEDNAVYEIIGDPEDIELRHQFLQFKVRRVKGGA